ncbi:MAG: hypothetical protein HQK53_06165 [Oligoflexia bacterium]|nr:hypothetical protein [Oligoflexia bacterium]
MSGKKHLLKKICILLLSITSTIAVSLEKPVTTFIWLSNNKEPLASKCYEVDIETQGQRFAKETSKINCRPASFEYKWIANSSGRTGKCFEIDISSKYLNSVDIKNCKPTDTFFYLYASKNGPSYCIEVDSETSGKNFLDEVNMSNCSPKVENFIWISDHDGLTGVCLAIDASGVNTLYKRAVKNDKCRPIKVAYYWIPEKNGVGGKCYEVDARNGPKFYSTNVAATKCIASSNHYTWIRDKNTMLGKCYEINTTTTENQAQVLSPVSIEKCKVEKTIKKWIKEGMLNGNCYEIDIETMGDKYIKPINKKECRPHDIVNILFTNNNNTLCYEVDEKTAGDEYAVATDIENCSDFKNTWVSAKNGLGGRCVRLIKSIRKDVEAKYCRPDNIAYMWVNLGAYHGECYEYNAVDGAKAYSLKVSTKFCKPQKTSFLFVPDPKGVLGGRCIEIDDKTKGDQYAVEISIDQCRQCEKFCVS